MHRSKESLLLLISWISDNLLLILSLFFFFILGYFYFTWPIVAYDTDLWYHLAGGRYIWDHKALPSNAFFSFISPTQEWYDYYWFFQVIVYRIFAWSGYSGLIVFRALIFLLTAFFIYRFFIKKNESLPNTVLSVFFFVFTVIALTHRDLLVRPHLFSFLFIAVFLYLIEDKGARLWLLPILGIFWSNIHGVEYPVILLILAAYLTEIFWKDLRKTGEPLGEAKRAKLFLFITFIAVFVTPNIPGFVKTPLNYFFGQSRFQYLYIREILPLPFEGILSFSLFPLSDIVGSMHNILIIFCLVAFLICLLKRQLRISHLILFVSASFLLAQHRRFIYEFILLSMPVIRHAIGLIHRDAVRFQKHGQAIAIGLLLVVIPIMIYSNIFKSRPKYPLSYQKLPRGVTVFLNQVDVGGKILNEPNTGGYLEWALSGKYKIFMDLQMALFRDEDYATVANAFANENTLKYVLGKFDPSFIAVNSGRTPFKNMIRRHPDFVPVFFDESTVLYANQRHVKGLADEYRLQSIDPYHFTNLDFENKGEKEMAMFLRESLKIHTIDPVNAVANSILCSIYRVQKEYGKAMAHADAVIENYPENWYGYFLKAEVSSELNRNEDAVRFCNMAVDRGTKMELLNVYRKLAILYNKLKMYDKGYKLYSQFVNPFDPDTDYKDIFELAIAAAAAGKQRDAQTFLRIAEMKTPTGDVESTKKIRDWRALLGESQPFYENGP